MPPDASVPAVAEVLSALSFWLVLGGSVAAYVYRAEIAAWFRSRI